MASTFFGLQIGASALTAYQASVNTTANNIANVQTEGYTRQNTNLETNLSMRVTARYGSAGTGVSAVSITQDRDTYYDVKYWNNNSSLGLYEQKLYYLNQMEDYFQDNNIQQGFSTIFSNMFNALDTVKNNAADESVRNQFINQAQVFCTYFNSLNVGLTSLQEDVNEEIKNQVQTINAMADKISMLNKEINSIEVNGGYANELRDERANIVDKLSNMVNVEVTEYDVQNSNGEALGGTNYTVIINGQVLVDGSDKRVLECISRDYRNNQNDADGLYHIVWQDTGMNFAAATTSASGTLKALFQIRDGNDAQALNGKVESATANSVTMTQPSVTALNELAIPDRGIVSINNKTYHYNGWSAEVGADGELTSYTFQITDEIPADILANIDGRSITCGQNVDGLGIPYYQQQINEFLRTFAQLFNDIEKGGQTLTGEQMGAFFEASNSTGTKYGFKDWEKDADGNFINPGTITSNSDSYYQMTAANAAVNAKSLKDPGYFSTAKTVENGKDAYDIVTDLKRLQEDVTMFRNNNAGSFLETLLADISVDTEKTKIFYSNYDNLVNAIGNQRTSVSGVDEDEEALNLIKFQNAYNLSSKIISVLSQMYDKLINETGV